MMHGWLRQDQNLKLKRSYQSSVQKVSKYLEAYLEKPSGTIQGIKTELLAALRRK